MVSIPASGSAGPSSILDMFSNLKSRKVNHEHVRDIRSVRKEGGIGAAVGESRTIPRYFSCSQSRTCPMYIAFWQLHSYLYFENFLVFWDSAYFLFLPC